VQSAPGDGGQAEAFAALVRLYRIGCPPGSVVALDLETAVAPSYVNAFAGPLHWAGFKVWVYGSRSTVFGNPALDGYWVAGYPGSRHFAAGSNVRATQWQAGKVIDSSVLRWYQWRRRLWR